MRHLFYSTALVALFFLHSDGVATQNNYPENLEVETDKKSKPFNPPGKKLGYSRGKGHLDSKGHGHEHHNHEQGELDGDEEEETPTPVTPTDPVIPLNPTPVTPAPVTLP